jgi:hypothetical protein
MENVSLFKDEGSSLSKDIWSVYPFLTLLRMAVSDRNPATLEKIFLDVNRTFQMKDTKFNHGNGG